MIRVILDVKTDADEMRDIKHRGQLSS
jgi:hypothetical protein